MDNKCPLCESPFKENYDGNREIYLIGCPNCGFYKIDLFLHDHSTLTSKEKTTLSHFIYNKRAKNWDESPLINSGNYKEIISNNPLPKPYEQADLLLEYIGDKLSESDEIKYIHNDEFNNLRARFGSLSGRNLEYIYEEMHNEGYIKKHPYKPTSEHKSTSTRDTESITLSLKGWQHYEEIKRGKSESDQGFMAMQFGDDLLNDFYKTLKASVSATNFHLIRMDEIIHTELIDNRMRTEIRRSKFLVADLTNRNCGAYWEAGYAEGLGKPVIYTCKKSYFESKVKGEGSHFDTNHQSIILWEEDKMDEAATKLIATIRITFPYEAKMLDEKPKE